MYRLLLTCVNIGFLIFYCTLFILETLHFCIPLKRKIYVSYRQVQNFYIFNIPIVAFYFFLMFQVTYKNQFFPISKSLAVFIQKEFPKVPFETIDNATAFFVDNTFISLIECAPTSSSSHSYITFPSIIRDKKFRVHCNLLNFFTTSLYMRGSLGARRGYQEEH